MPITIVHAGEEKLTYTWQFQELSVITSHKLEHIKLKFTPLNSSFFQIFHMCNHDYLWNAITWLFSNHCILFLIKGA